MNSSYLFRYMHHLFGAFALCGAYLAATSALIWYFEPSQFQPYIRSFVISFNCVVSGGFIFSAMFFAIRLEKSVPSLIEEAIDQKSLSKTKYAMERQKYLSVWRATVFCANYMVCAFGIFYFCQFPLSGIAQFAMMAFACAQYGAGVLVGRKLYFISRMLDAIAAVTPRKNVFRSGDINNIASYVNILSTLTVIFTYVHVRSFYSAPFLYHTPLGPTVKILLLLPVLIATPVIVVFNFYPRIVLRKLYAKSIELEVNNLKKTLKREQLSEFDRMSFLVEYDRLAKEEVKGRLQLSISDLPMAVTIIISIIGIIMKL